MMQVRTPEVSVVIPSYNRKESVGSLVQDILRQEGVVFEILVSDDYSTDGSVEALRKQFPQIQVLEASANRGPAAARNSGIRAAKASVIVGFDSDVSVSDRHLLRRIVDRFSKEPSLSGIALRVMDATGREDDRPRWWHPRRIEEAVEIPFETSYFSGTGYAFRTQSILSAGLFPEVFFMHYEEVELAFRIIDQGGIIRHAPDLCVNHHAHPTPTRGRVQEYFKPRNQILIALRCYPILAAIRYLAPRIPYNLLVAMRHGSTKRCLAAIADGVRMAPEALRTRKAVSAKHWGYITGGCREARIPSEA